MHNNSYLLAEQAHGPDSGLLVRGPLRLRQALQAVLPQLAGRPLDAGLAHWLNQSHGAGSATYRALQQACEAGVKEGWLCTREGAGMRYGRVFKASEGLQHFSVDVVDMADVVGPHHVHPLGEIDLIMPLTEGACFDGQPAGWHVCEPGSAHSPSVTGGRALVLYLLPEGQIEFTRS